MANLARRQNERLAPNNNRITELQHRKVNVNKNGGDWRLAWGGAF